MRIIVGRLYQIGDGVNGWLVGGKSEERIQIGTVQIEKKKCTKKPGSKEKSTRMGVGSI